MSQNMCSSVDQLGRRSDRSIVICPAFRAIAVTALLLATGCARSFQFRAVDANSGLLLSEVAVDRYSTQDDVVLGSQRDREQLPSTNTAGITSASGLPSNWMHYFRFQKPGYADAEVAWEPSDRFLLLSPTNDPRLQYQPMAAASVIKVPMHPLRSPHGDGRPV
jgi:hypothetical protein